MGVAVAGSLGARERVDACLSYRAATWPTTVNARLFIHARNWRSTRSAASAWIGQQLAISAGRIRLDRIYQEIQVTTIDHVTEPPSTGGAGPVYAR